MIKIKKINRQLMHTADFEQVKLKSLVNAELSTGHLVFFLLVLFR
jgi:hypothetical protein